MQVDDKTEVGVQHFTLWYTFHKHQVLNIEGFLLNICKTLGMNIFLIFEL